LGMMRGAIMILGLEEGAFVAVVATCGGCCVVDTREKDRSENDNLVPLASHRALRSRVQTHHTAA
jgi:hypothetical protein